MTDVNELAYVIFQSFICNCQSFLLLFFLFYLHRQALAVYMFWLTEKGAQQELQHLSIFASLNTVAHINYIS